MPMYEYRCDSCGYAFERYSAGKSVEDDAGICAKCSKGRVKKIFSTFASSCCSSSAGLSPSPGGCGGGKSPFS